MRRKIGTMIASGALLLGATASGAVALEATAYNGQHLAVSAWTSSYGGNADRQVNLRDERADGRWVRTQWKQQNTHGERVFGIDNRSGANTTVTYQTSGRVTRINACYSGAGIHPMHCDKTI